MADKLELEVLASYDANYLESNHGHSKIVRLTEESISVVKEIAPYKIINSPFICVTCKKNITIPTGLVTFYITPRGMYTIDIEYFVREDKETRSPLSPSSPPSQNERYERYEGNEGRESERVNNVDIEDQKYKLKMQLWEALGVMIKHRDEMDSKISEMISQIKKLDS